MGESHLHQHSSKAFGESSGFTVHQGMLTTLQKPGWFQQKERMCQVLLSWQRTYMGMYVCFVLEAHTLGTDCALPDPIVEEATLEVRKVMLPRSGSWRISDA